ncbi:hypothetical protein CYMTET_10112 [Cymbomonas tetramitiformis]|uniref:Uncharacterized protein n=1 Tax=Cymbomonas tetramitiformis TaxID=36881 RepID=A0AAE0LEC3_9CHLO|nr:hypothetical protein CYMTET_10112 [Cymbomonas tetramitiformis]
MGQGEKIKAVSVELEECQARHKKALVELADEREKVLELTMEIVEFREQGAQPTHEESHTTLAESEEAGPVGDALEPTQTWYCRPDRAEERLEAGKYCQMALSSYGLVFKKNPIKQGLFASAGLDLTSAVPVTLGDAVYLIGGRPIDHASDAFMTETSDELQPEAMIVCRHETTSGRWVLVTTGGSIPAAREGHCAVLQANESGGKKPSILVMGGRSPCATLLYNDFYRLDLETMLWEKITDAAPVGGLMTAASILGPQNTQYKTVVFGQDWEDKQFTAYTLMERIPPSQPQSQPRPQSSNTRGTGGSQRPRSSLAAFRGQKSTFSVKRGPAFQEVNLAKLYVDTNLPSLPALAPFRWKANRHDRQDDPATRFYGQGTERRNEQEETIPSRSPRAQRPKMAYQVHHHVSQLSKSLDDFASDQCAPILSLSPSQAELMS